MCGIVGYIGKDNCIQKIISCLESLEYRGYDSAGIAYVTDKGVNLEKSEGRIENLKKDLDMDIPSTIGIGHTRWATHGEPSDVNSHPHVSNSGNIAVVHNGIIENYIELKEMLIEKGYEFDGVNGEIYVMKEDKK